MQGSCHAVCFGLSSILSGISVAISPVSSVKQLQKNCQNPATRASAEIFWDEERLSCQMRQGKLSLTERAHGMSQA
jgi:hypothetical protein